MQYVMSLGPSEMVSQQFGIEAGHLLQFAEKPRAVSPGYYPEQRALIMVIALCPHTIKIDRTSSEKVVIQDSLHVGEGDAYVARQLQIKELMVEMVQGITADLLYQIWLSARFAYDPLDGLRQIIKRELFGRVGDQAPGRRIAEVGDRDVLVGTV